MSALTDRASLLNEYFRLVNADATDDDMIEHDATTLEGTYANLQAGCWDAQLYLIDCGVGDRWAKTSPALSFTGTDPDRYADLPADFLRLDGNERESPLRTASGVQWGQLIPHHMRWRAWGNRFYVRGNEAESAKEGQLRLYLCRGASPLSGLVADYFYRHATLADSTTVDFPSEDRQLIPAFAAKRASHQSWFAGGIEQKQAIEENLRFLKGEAWRRTRHSRQPKMVDPYPMTGDRWYA